MLFHSWLRTLRSVLTRRGAQGKRRRASHQQPAARVRPHLEVLEDRLVPAAASWTGGGGDFLWGNAANWSDNAVPGSGDDVQINAPGVTISQPASATVQSLTLQGGTLTGGALTVTGSSAWSGGTLLNSTLRAMGGTTISGNTTLDGSTLVNALNQTTSLTGNLDLYDGAEFDNEGSLVLGNTGLMSRGDTSAVLLLNNGSITKPCGSGNAGLHLPIDSCGPITLGAGALDLGDDGGSTASTFYGSVTGAAGTVLYLTGGTSVSSFMGDVTADTVIFYPGDAGSYQVQGAYFSNSTQIIRGSVTFTGTVNQLGDLTVNGGTMDLTQATLAPGAANLPNLVDEGTLVVPQPLTVQNLTLGGTLVAPDLTVGLTFNWSGGTLAGPGTTIISSTATMTFLSGYELNYFLQGEVLVNFGTTVLVPGDEDELHMSAGATIDNYGSVLAEGGLVPAPNYSELIIAAAGTDGIFLNDGTFTDAAAAGTLVQFQAAFVNNGTVLLQSGVSMEILNDNSSGSGGFSVGAGAELDCSGTFGGAFTGAANSILQLGYFEFDMITLLPSAQIVSAGEVVIDYDTFTLPFANGPSGVQFASISAASVSLQGYLNITEITPLPTYVGETFTIVNNTSSNPIGGLGMFANLGEGAVTTLSDGTQLRIDYGGGDGNDVVLTVIVSPVVATTTAVTANNANYDGLQHGATAMVSPGSPAGTTSFLYTGTGDYSSSVAPTNAGTYHVVASFTPSNPSAYLPSTGFADYGISQAGSTTTVTLGSEFVTGSVTYDGNMHGASASWATTGQDNAGAPLTVYYVGINGTTYASSTTAPTNAGNYQASAAYPGDTNHTGSSNTADFTIAQASAGASVIGYSIPYDGNSHTATGSATDVHGMALPSSDFILTSTTHTSAGTYNGDAWSFSDPSGNYQATSGAVNDSIAQAGSTTTVTLGAEFVNGSVTYNGSAHGATASWVSTGTDGAGASLTVSYVGINGTTYASSTTAPTNAGNYQASAAYPGDTNHTGSSGYANFTIVADAVTIAGDVYILNSSAAGALTSSGGALNVMGQLQVDSSASTAINLGGNAVVNATTVVDLGGAVASGNADLNATGSINIGGTASLSGRAFVDAGSSLNIGGGYQISGEAYFNKTPTSSANAPYAADPLAHVLAPTAGADRGAINVSGNTSLTINPGTYDSIGVSGNGILIMTPGTYYIGTGGISITGNASVTSTGGVLLYNNGALTITGNASVNLTAESSGDYQNVAIFQARNNASAALVSGNAVVNLNNAVFYSANGQSITTMSGNAVLDATLIVNELNISGNSDDNT